MTDLCKTNNKMFFVMWESKSKSSHLHVSTDVINQIPQTARDGINNFLKDIIWEIIENPLNPCLQLLQCAKFSLVHLCVIPQVKITWSEIGTSWRPFMESVSSHPTSWKILA